MLAPGVAETAGFAASRARHAPCSWFVAPTMDWLRPNQVLDESLANDSGRSAATRGRARRLAFLTGTKRHQSSDAHAGLALHLVVDIRPSGGAKAPDRTFSRERAADCAGSAPVSALLVPPRHPVPAPRISRLRG